MANQFLALSLFIMLLSFFIVLNALSNFEEVKSRPVLNSLSLAFSSKSIEEDDAPSFEQNLEKAFNNGNAIDQLDALFKSQVVGYESKQNRLGTLMYVRLPVRTFERAVMAATQTQMDPTRQSKGLGGFFLPTMVSILKSEKTGVPYRMDVLLLTPGNPAVTQNEKPQDAARDVQKVSMYAQRLEEAGLPAKLLSAGLEQGKEGYIDIYFRRHEPFNPLGENAGAGNDN